jgi:uncharacterized protein (DUF58 family)
MATPVDPRPPRVAPLGLAVLTVLGWAVALAIAAARVELFAVAVPLALALATLARRPPAVRLSVGHEISSDRVVEGERLTVTITVEARSDVPLVEIAGPLPADGLVASGNHRAAMSLRAGAAGRFSYDVGFPGRGMHDLGTVHVRVRDRFGLWTWGLRHVDPKPVRAYPRIAALRSLPRPVHAQASVGDYVSAALGEGIEPGDIREFAPGDRIKQVNWRASLRLGTLHVTQQHRERNADVVLMVDTLSEVGAAPDTTLDCGIRAAASLAAAYLGRKDRVGLINYGGVMHWVKPGSGRVQYERLADALIRATVVFTYVAKDLAVVPPRVLPPQALVIAVTPLCDRRFTKAVLDLAARGFDLVALVVSPVDLTRAAVRPSVATDLACRLWDLERREQLAALRRQGIPVLEWRPTEPLEAAVAGAGRRRPRLAAAGR